MSKPSTQVFHQSFVHAAQAAEHHGNAMNLAVPLVAPDSSLNSRFVDQLRALLAETDFDAKSQMMQELLRQHEAANEEATARIFQIVGETEDEQRRNKLLKRVWQWAMEGTKLIEIRVQLDEAARQQRLAERLHQVAMDLQSVGL